MNTTSQKLYNIKPCHWATVIGIDKDCPILRRFIDIGLTEGTRVKCVIKSPSGGIGAYMIRGALIAIRDRDCEHVTVKEECKWD